MQVQTRKFSANRYGKYEASNQVDSEALKLHPDEPKIPPMAELYQKPEDVIPLFKEKEIQSKRVLHDDIIQSKYRFF